MIGVGIVGKPCRNIDRQPVWVQNDILLLFLTNPDRMAGREIVTATAWSLVRKMIGGKVSGKRW